MLHIHRLVATRAATAAAAGNFKAGLYLIYYISGWHTRTHAFIKEEAVRAPNTTALPLFRSLSLCLILSLCRSVCLSFSWLGRLSQRAATALDRLLRLGALSMQICVASTGLNTLKYASQAHLSLFPLSRSLSLSLRLPYLKLLTRGLL